MSENTDFILPNDDDASESQPEVTSENLKIGDVVNDKKFIETFNEMLYLFKKAKIPSERRYPNGDVAVENIFVSFEIYGKTTRKNKCSPPIVRIYKYFNYRGNEHLKELLISESGFLLELDKETTHECTFTPIRGDVYIEKVIANGIKKLGFIPHEVSISVGDDENGSDFAIQSFLINSWKFEYYKSFNLW